MPGQRVPHLEVVDEHEHPPRTDRKRLADALEDAVDALSRLCSRVELHTQAMLRDDEGFRLEGDVLPERRVESRAREVLDAYRKGE